IQNRFSNSNFVARKEGSVVAAVSVAKLRFRSCRRGTLCLRHGYSAFFCCSSDHPLALVRLSKITGKILLLKKVSVPGRRNHCRFPAPVVKQLCPKFCSTISRSF